MTSVAHGNHIKIQLPNAKTLDEVVIQGLPKRRKQGSEDNCAFRIAGRLKGCWVVFSAWVYLPSES
jgi:hypothetical protein